LEICQEPRRFGNQQGIRRPSPSGKRETAGPNIRGSKQPNRHWHHAGRHRKRSGRLGFDRGRRAKSSLPWCRIAGLGYCKPDFDRQTGLRSFDCPSPLRGGPGRGCEARPASLTVEIHIDRGFEAPRNGGQAVVGGTPAKKMHRPVSPRKPDARPLTMPVERRDGTFGVARNL